MATSFELKGGIALYALCDPISGKMRYIGYSNAVKRRYRKHCRAVDHTHRDCWIRSLAKKGMTPSLKMLAVVGDHEIAVIAMLRRRGLKLTNGTRGGDGVIGHTPSAETRAKISAAHAGKRLTEEQKAKLRVPKPPRTAEHRARLSAAHAAMTEDQRRQRSERMSVAHKGRKLSDEHRKKLSIAHTGVKRAPFSAEHRARLSAAHMGRSNGPHSEETKALIGAAHRNKKRNPLPPEQRAKLSASLKAYWAKRRLAVEVLQ